MDSPIIIALAVFLGIFLMFFIISLLSDLLIVGIVLSSAVLAYFIPEIYQASYFQGFLHNQLSFLQSFGISFPAELDAATYYLIGALIVFAGTLICIPVLPFSAVYRQMLGANKISGRDEHKVRAIVVEELELVRQRVAAERMKQQQKALKRKIKRPDDENEEEDFVQDARANWLVRTKAKLHDKWMRFKNRRNDEDDE
jgi:hypothetical protein